MVWLGGSVCYRVVRSSVGDAGRLHPVLGLGVGEVAAVNISFNIVEPRLRQRYVGVQTGGKKIIITPKVFDPYFTAQYLYSSSDTEWYRIIERDNSAPPVDLAQLEAGLHQQVLVQMQDYVIDVMRINK